jgi:hypothetical protein
MRAYTEAYQQRGFVVVPDIFGSDECTPIAELVERVVSILRAHAVPMSSWS